MVALCVAVIDHFCPALVGCLFGFVMIRSLRNTEGYISASLEVSPLYILPLLALNLSFKFSPGVTAKARVCIFTI